MKNFKYQYQYIDPLTKGFTRIKVTKDNHNKVFKYSQRTFWKDLVKTVEYYENKECIKVQTVISIFGKLLLLTLSPILILYYGIGNKEIYTEIKRTLSDKKYGAFTSDCIFDKEIINTLKGLYE